MFDAAPQDCAISDAEIGENPVVRALLSPDVEMDGMPLLAFAFRFSAVPAAFAR